MSARLMAKYRRLRREFDVAVRDCATLDTGERESVKRPIREYKKTKNQLDRFVASVVGDLYYRALNK